MEHVAATGTRAPAAEPTLGRWIGYQADTADGRLGTVVCELRHSHCGRPASVVVRRGLFCERHTLVPLSEIERVLPAERRLVLRDGCRIDAIDAELCRPPERRPRTVGSPT